MSDDVLQLHHQIEGDGPAVVFTHGWMNTGEVWAGSVAALDGAATSLRWDLRGHGQSDVAPEGDYGRDFALGDLDRMVGTVDGRAILVGHSLGGYLSLAYAILHPERVAGLVLVAAGPGFRSKKSLEEWNGSVRGMAAKADIPPGMEAISMHVDSMVMDRLDEIRAPVVTIVGERDKRFLASADVFDKHLDVQERIIVTEAGHMVHAKHPDVVAAGVRSLLPAVPPTAME